MIVKAVVFIRDRVFGNTRYMIFLTLNLTIFSSDTTNMKFILRSFRASNFFFFFIKYTLIDLYLIITFTFG
jgi:hypothetical protein